jgi:hypothetical protein
MYTGLYSVEDISLIERSGLTLEEVDANWKMFPDQNLDTAIGETQILKNGRGQERNEPFTKLPTEDGAET